MSLLLLLSLYSKDRDNLVPKASCTCTKVVQYGTVWFQIKVMNGQQRQQWQSCPQPKSSWKLHKRHQFLPCPWQLPCRQPSSSLSSSSLCSMLYLCGRDGPVVAVYFSLVPLSQGSSDESSCCYCLAMTQKGMSEVNSCGFIVKIIINMLNMWALPTSITCIHASPMISSHVSSRKRTTASLSM